MKLVSWYPVRDWVPPVDILEHNDHFIIRAELPGVSKDGMDVHVEDGVLTLSGERKREAGANDGAAFRTERIYGAFARSFTLPTTVDASKVSAAYKDGVLTVTVPKAEAAKPKKVEILAA